MPHILGAVEQQGLLLAEAYRVLRNDGMFIISEFNGWRAKSHKLWQQLNKKVPQSINKPIQKRNKFNLKKLLNPKACIAQLMSLQNRVFQLEQFGFEIVKNVSFTLDLPRKNLAQNEQKWYHRFKTKSTGLQSSLCLGYVLLVKKAYRN